MATPVFYRIKSEKKLFSFNDDISNVPILGRPLSWWQNEAIKTNDAIIKDVESEDNITETQYFIFNSDLFFTKEFIKQIIEHSKNNKSYRFTIEENSFNDRFVLPDSKESSDNLKFNFFYKVKNSGLSEQTVFQKIYEHKSFIPSQIVKSGFLSYAQSATIIARVASPFHLLQINMAVNLMKGLKFKGRLPKWLIDIIAPVYSPNYHRALKRINKIGKKCRIHKTAILEGVVLGDNVVVGAGTVIRMSEIGSNTIIEENSTIAFSVLGKKNYISAGNSLRLCMSYDGVFLIHGPYQFSIFGKNVAAMAVINCDYRLDQENIKIPTDVGVLDSNQPLLGLAYGHNSSVGGGNIIAPGRIVPNNKKITPPGIIITHFT